LSLIQALIFDFDGLILDTELPAYRSWQEILEEYGCHLPLALWATRIGTNASPFDALDFLEAQIGRPVDRESLRHRRERRRAELIRKESLRPGIEFYLADAHRMGLQLAVASSSPRAFFSRASSRYFGRRKLPTTSTRNAAVGAITPPRSAVRRAGRRWMLADHGHHGPLT